MNDSYNRAKGTLSGNLELLHSLAAALLERETLTADDIEILIRGEKLPPRKVGSSSPAAIPTEPVTQPRAARPPLLGGPEVAPA